MIETELDVLRDVSRRLESAGIAFMLTGSMAMNYYWARDSRSEVQFRDIKNLLSSDCDMSYLQSRAEMLGVKSLLLEFLNTHE
jgi:hypothetical protein